MLANVVGVPLGAFAGQAMGWRGPFRALAVLGAGCVVFIARHVPPDGPSRQTVSIRSELTAVRSGRLWLVLVGFGVGALAGFLVRAAPDDSAGPSTMEGPADGVRGRARHVVRRSRVSAPERTGRRPGRGRSGMRVGRCWGHLRR
ncbi:hypothetical protein [Streptomyces sp. NPDC127039]|uniref:hypothetical protein n=1 Tax=Streptomyces sp. NPDC127039 TaxID=3347115 RepID=UPI00365C6CD9